MEGNTLLVNITVRNDIKKYIEFFFQEEMRNENCIDQLTHISEFDLTTLSYIRPMSITYVHDMIKLKAKLNHLFKPESTLNTLGFKIENLMLRLIATFGKNIFDQIKNEQIEYLLSINVRERSVKTSFFWDLVTIKGYFKRRKKIKENRKLMKVYEEDIREIFDIFPCLCIVPFLSECLYRHVNNYK